MVVLRVIDRCIAFPAPPMQVFSTFVLHTKKVYFVVFVKVSRGVVES
jgi:hypothetical protein